MDNFLDEFDLQYSFTRSELESVCSDIFNRLRDITNALLVMKEDQQINKIEVVGFVNNERLRDKREIYLKLNLLGELLEFQQSSND